MTGKIELRWGLIIGGVYLLWLYLSFFLGFHTSGIAKVQMMTLVMVVLSAAGYVLALNAVFKETPELTFGEGLRSGAVICGIATLLVMVAQFGYHKWIHPGFTDYMVEESKVYYETQGLKGEDLEMVLDGARKTFGFTSYLLQSTIGSLFGGIVFSAVMVGFKVLKRR